jgi:hypothetical protein
LPFDPPDDPFDPSDDPFDPSDDPFDPSDDPWLRLEASPSVDFEPLALPSWFPLADLLERSPASELSLDGLSKEPSGSDMPSPIPSSPDAGESGNCCSADWPRLPVSDGFGWLAFPLPDELSWRSG